MIYKVRKKNTLILQSLLISLGVSLTACVGDNQSQPTATKQMQITKAQASTLDHGIITYYFMDDSNTPAFSVPLMNTNTIKHNLAQYHDRIAKHLVAKFDLIVEKSGTYQLSTSDNGAAISIDGVLAANQNIKFESGVVYSIAVAYAPKNAIVKDLELYWLEPGAKTITKIPTNNILFATTKSLSNKSILAKTGSKCTAMGLKDSSCNGIPDDWAVNGYTVRLLPKTKEIVLEKWDKDLHHSPSNKKFFSALYKFSTADDPYSDYEKVTGIGLDPGVLKDARNPLVAALPIINAKSEGVIISKNTTTTTDINGSKGQSITISTSNSFTDGTSNDVGGSLSIAPTISIFPPSVGGTDTIMAKYDHQWNHSQMLNQGKDTAGSVNNGWSTSLSMNNGDAALFQPILRYENIGTAPVYNLAPTFTFIEPKQKLILTSVTAKSNSIANILLPNNTYPVTSQPGILISGIDDFNSAPAKLNKTQLDALEISKIFNTYVSQFTANVKFFNSSGQPINLSDRDNVWSTYLTQSMQTTTQIKLFTPDNKIKVRNIASMSIEPYNLVEQAKPEVLLGDALAMIGGPIYNESFQKWEIIGEDGKVSYQLAGIDIFSDPETSKEINKQLLEMSGPTKDIRKVKLRPKMQLNVCPKGLVKNLSNQKSTYWTNCADKTLNKLVWLKEPDGNHDLLQTSSIDIPIDYYRSVGLDVGDNSSFDIISSNPNIADVGKEGTYIFKILQKSVGRTTITIKYKGTNIIAKTLTVNVLELPVQNITLDNIGSKLTEQYHANGKNSVGFLVPDWSNAIPDGNVLLWNAKRGPSIIEVDVTNNDGKKYKLKVSGFRYIPNCSVFQLNGAVGCGTSDGALAKLSIDDSLNKSLPNGTYKGDFELIAKSWHDPSYAKRIKININWEPKSFTAYFPGNCQLKAKDKEVPCECLQDVTTGDVWPRTPTGKNQTYNILMSPDGYISSLNKNNTCGFSSGWGLPTEKQLRTMLQYLNNNQNSSNWFNEQGFDIPLGDYWGEAYDEGGYWAQYCVGMKKLAWAISIDRKFITQGCRDATDIYGWGVHSTR